MRKAINRVGGLCFYCQSMRVTYYCLQCSSPLSCRSSEHDIIDDDRVWQGHGRGVAGTHHPWGIGRGRGLSGSPQSLPQAPLIVLPQLPADDSEETPSTAVRPDQLPPGEPYLGTGAGTDQTEHHGQASPRCPPICGRSLPGMASNATFGWSQHKVIKMTWRYWLIMMQAMGLKHYRKRREEGVIPDPSHTRM